MNLSQATRKGNQLLSKISSQWRSVKLVTAPRNLARASSSTYEASMQRTKAEAKNLLSQIGSTMSQIRSIISGVDRGDISSKFDVDDDEYWKEGQDFMDFEKRAMSYLKSPEWEKLQSLAKDSQMNIKRQMNYHARQYHRLKALEQRAKTRKW